MRFLDCQDALFQERLLVLPSVLLQQVASVVEELVRDVLLDRPLSSLACRVVLLRSSEQRAQEAIARNFGLFFEREVCVEVVGLRNHQIDVATLHILLSRNHSRNAGLLKQPQTNFEVLYLGLYPPNKDLVLQNRVVFIRLVLLGGSRLRMKTEPGSNRLVKLSRLSWLFLVQQLI